MRCRISFSSKELESLKRPAGILINDDEITREKIEEYLTHLTISIGDATTDRLISLGIVPEIQIVDGKERRSNREAAGKYYSTEIRCANPSGGITSDAIRAFRYALDSEKPVRIMVDGEEDLFGLIALAFAPLNTMIFYGQPLEGIVALRVDDDNKAKFRNMLDAIIRLGDDDVAAV